MNFEQSDKDRFTRSSIINLQDHYSTNIMDVRSRKLATTTQTHQKAKAPLPFKSVEKKKMERSLSQGGSGRRLFSVSYFSLESLLLLICLTASLLILPLILPPLPPPPFLLLLLLPIGILALLMVLAFMPTNARDIANTYM